MHSKNFSKIHRNPSKKKKSYAKEKYRFKKRGCVMSIQEPLQQLFASLLQLLSAFFKPIILIPVIITVIVLIKKNKEYKNSAYYQATKLPYYSVKRNTGRYGEYLTYKHLKRFEANGARFLFNIYIPKENGETTEIDVLMICSRGIFVFESKNYSGWIFGNETQINWYQTLPNGKGRSHKERFYNPIMQNRSHIKHLKALLDEEVPVRSIIVFSDRCTLKSLQIKSNDISVINRHNVASVVSDICNHISNDSLSESDITNLYNKLYPYTQIDDFAKAQHIVNIHNNLNSQPIRQPAPTITENPIQATVAEQIENDKDIQSQAETATTRTKITNLTEKEPELIKPDNIEPQLIKCPKCNGILVLRTATRGINAGKQFYGCSNYPKCKYIQNI